MHPEAEAEGEMINTDVHPAAKYSRTMLIDKNWHTRNDFARSNLLQVGGSVAK